MLHALSFFKVHVPWEEPLPMRARRFKLVAPQPRAVLIDQVVSFRKKVANQRTLSEGQRLSHLLPLLRKKATGKYDPLASLRIVKVLHQAEIIEMPLDSTSHVAGLSDVQSLELAAPSSPEDVHPGPRRDLRQVEAIDHIVFGRVLELNRPAPLDVQLHVIALTDRRSLTNSVHQRLLNAAPAAGIFPQFSRQ
jgi:hypothetical protein